MADVTDRLRAMLDERGVEYETDDGKTVEKTTWQFDEGLFATFVAYDDGTTAFSFDARYFTPEQAIAATLGSGKLTADQVRNAIFMASVWDEEAATCLVSRTDMQAIADELNAALGSGTCEWLPVESCRSFAGPGWECSSCGHEVGNYEHDRYNCCPICCAEVKR